MSKVTWLTPYYECWQRIGIPSVVRMAKVMKPIEADLGPDRALAALNAFLTAGHGRYGIEVFARAYHDWDDQVRHAGLSRQEQTARDALESFTGEL